MKHNSKFKNAPYSTGLNKFQHLIIKLKSTQWLMVNS